MVFQRQVGLALMAAAVVLFVLGHWYVKSAEQALLTGHTLTQQGECVHQEQEVCPFQQMNKLAVPKYLGLFADLVLFACGLHLFLKTTPEERALRQARKTAHAVGGPEGKAYEEIMNAGGMIFQNALVEKLGMSKVQVTRILDKLEGKGLVERRRRGMTNVVILKPQ